MSLLSSVYSKVNIFLFASESVYVRCYVSFFKIMLGRSLTNSHYHERYMLHGYPKKNG